jgi:hypothetical protein
MGMVQTGYDSTAWDGIGGIISSVAASTGGITSLAVSDSVNVFGLTPSETTIWEGQTIDASTVIVKYTWSGDGNLDGVVDGGDYGIIDNNVQIAGAYGYFNGDFNYDGVIDGGDYGIIDNIVHMQGVVY